MTSLQRLVRRFVLSCRTKRHPQIALLTLIVLAGAVRTGGQAPAGAPAGAPTGWELSLVDLDGTREVLARLPVTVYAPRVSPDGRRVAFETRDQSGPDGPRLWTADITDVGARNPLPLVVGQINWAPMWTPDGQRLVFIVSGADRPDAVYSRRADGTGEAEHLLDTRSGEGWVAGSAQMRFLTLTGNRDYGIALLDMKTRAVTPFVDLPGSAQHSSAMSPDGRWMAYTSNETGRYEIWVEPFPRTGTRHQLTRDGGSHPLWAPDGQSLYFDRGQQMFRLAVNAREMSAANEPFPLPIRGFQQAEYRRQFDLMPNGRQFLMLFPVFGAASAQDQGRGCTDLTRPGRFPSTVVQTARLVAAEPKTGMPAYCEVTAQIAPVPGSTIMAVYRLPENWNGRMLGLGGGGWAGNTYLSVPTPGPGRTADLGLTRGYATAQTDGGHPSLLTTDVSWTRNNPMAVTNFSHRAMHEMTMLGKQIVASHYGRAATKSYYQGCSTGGRMGMMEAQRYPDDYDGIVAGAPVYSLLVQSSTVVRDQIFKAPGAAIPPELLQIVHDAVLGACDANDGLKDGIVTDPRRCTWAPESLQCREGAAAGSCLTPPQVAAVNKAYRTVRTRSGVVGNYGLTRGSETGWNPFVPTVSGPRNVLNGDLGDLIPLMFPDSRFDPATFDIERQQAAIHRTPFAAEYEASSTDLKKFFGRGGKLLLWHGLDDAAPSPFATIDYYERVVKVDGDSNIRFFALPGVYHCGGGPGADSFDPLTALERWSESREAPTQMLATNRTTGIERPVCAWPRLPYYRRGDPARASSFVCR